MNKRIRTIPLPYRNVGKCAENVIMELARISAKERKKSHRKN